MRTLVWTLASLVLVGCVATAAWSSEADELRAKAKAVQKEADHAAKEGRGEEAEKLSRHVKELLQAAQKHEQKSANAPNREDELQQQLKALAEKQQSAEESKNKDALAELRELRELVERELAVLREHGERKIAPKNSGKHPPKAVEETGLRIKHIRVAVENLNAAGLHDIAEELAHKADAMEREQHQAHEKNAKAPSVPQKQKQPDKGTKHAESEGKHPEPKGKHAPDAGPVDDLRHEVHRLRAELNELREGLKKRP